MVQRTELVTLDEALPMEHVPELLYLALTCVLPGGPSVKTRI